MAEDRQSMDNLDPIVTPADASRIWVRCDGIEDPDRKWTLTNILAWLRSKFGTAIDSDVQSSLTDTTADRLMKVGAFGLGSRAQKEFTDGYDSTGPSVIVPDTLRASVEAASGGRVTVLYDDLGLPSYMVRVPAFNVEDIHSDYGSGRHPAFVVNGVKKPEIFIGMHQAYVYQNRALSLPGLDPTTSIDYDTATLRCSAKGSGWHLMTNWEWAAVALWVLKQTEDGILAGQPRGNTNYGRSHEEYQETGTRQDGATYDPGETDGYARILTGSGPATWRHDLLNFGISDLVGNIWEWVGGLKTDGGRIYMPADNHWGLAESSWPATSVYVAKDGTTPRLSDAPNEISEDYVYEWWRSLSITAGYGALPLATREQMMQALIAPRLTDAATDPFTTHAEGRFYIRTADERVPLRGGSWFDGSVAGLGALNLHYLRSASSTRIGFRPAFVAP